MRAILPTLSILNYEGCSEYLEDFLDRIDTPRVDHVTIYYSMQEIHTSQLSRFIKRAENLKIDQFARAHVYFYPHESLFGLNRTQEAWTAINLDLKILNKASLEVQVRDMVQLIGQISPTFSKVDDLFAHGDTEVQFGGPDITEWLTLFRLFPAVETLRLSGWLAVFVAAALEGIAEDMVTDVLPALRLIRVVEVEDEEKDADDWLEQIGSMERFLSLRQLSGCPVTVIYPEDELAEVEKRW